MQAEEIHRPVGQVDSRHQSAFLFGPAGLEQGISQSGLQGNGACSGLYTHHVFGKERKLVEKRYVLERPASDTVQREVGIVVVISDAEISFASEFRT